MPFVNGGTGGGGGSSPFTILGPYAVSYTDVDPVSWVDLGALADGTIIWKVSIIVREAFTTTNEVLTVSLGIITGGDQLLLTDAYVDQDAYLASAMAARERTEKTAGLGVAFSFLGVAQHGAHLVVSDTAGGNSAGSVDIYALASLPA